MDIRCLITMLYMFGFGRTFAYTRTKEMCRFCLLGFFEIECKTCHANIICDIRTRIKITTVKYRDKHIHCHEALFECGVCCYEKLEISAEHREHLIELCNGRQTCNIDSWKPNLPWSMKISYVCEYPTIKTVVSTTTTPLHKTTTEVTVVSTSTTPTAPIHEATCTTVSPSLPKWEQVPSKISTESINLVTINHADSRSETSSVTTVAVSVTAGILIVLVIVLVGVVYIKRRKTNIKTNDSTNVQRVDYNVVAQTVTNRSGCKTNPIDQSTGPGENYEQLDVYTGVNIAPYRFYDDGSSTVQAVTNSSKTGLLDQSTKPGENYEPLHVYTTDVYIAPNTIYDDGSSTAQAVTNSSKTGLLDQSTKPGKNYEPLHVYTTDVYIAPNTIYDDGSRTAQAVTNSCKTGLLDQSTKPGENFELLHVYNDAHIASNTTYDDGCSTAQAVTNSYKTGPLDQNNKPGENYEQLHVYTDVHIATNTINEDSYSTLNEKR